MVKKQFHGLQAAMADGDEQWVDEVNIGVGSGLQQQLCGVDVVVKNSKVEWGGASVLVQAGALIREGSVDLVAGLYQLLQDVVIVALGRQVQGADATPLDAGAAGHRDQHGHNPARRRLSERQWALGDLPPYSKLWLYDCTRKAEPANSGTGATWRNQSANLKPVSNSLCTYLAKNVCCVTFPFHGGTHFFEIITQFL